jgi:23S rRNA pseudouridine1911/1915/1917 synthase
VSEGERRRFRAGSEGRLDHILVDRFPEHSRSQLQRLIREGLVLVGGEPVPKTGFALDGGEEIEITFPPPSPSSLTPEQIPLNVIFENDDVLVVNKPAGMVTHPSAGHQSGTLVHAALAHAPNLRGVGGERRPGVVHRLDKETSGVILMAKHDKAHRFLQRQFKERAVEKRYLALVEGRPPTPSGKIDAPISRDPNDRKKMAVVSLGQGRESITVYHTREIFSRHTLLEVHPETGRTHQIRLHLAFLGCPVVGDTQYGWRRPSLEIERHFLHAAEIRVKLPGERAPRTLRAELPADLADMLARLRDGTQRGRNAASGGG